MRLLFSSPHCLLDPASGAAVSTRDLLDLLAGRDWACVALCGLRTDSAQVSPTALTGMIQVRHVGGALFEVVSDEVILDKSLHDLGQVRPVNMNIQPSSLAGAGLNDWVPFRITLGTIGVLQLNYIGGAGLGSTIARPDNAMGPGGTHATSVRLHYRIMVDDIDRPHIMSLEHSLLISACAPAR